MEYTFNDLVKAVVHELDERKAAEAEANKPLTEMEKYNKKQEIMSIKDTELRQKMIAENLELFVPRRHK